MSKLFEPIKLGDLEIKNRIVRAPFQLSDNLEGGFVQQPKIDMYKTLSENEIGLIMTGQSAVLPGIGLSDYIDFMYYDLHIAEHKKIVEAAHAGGAKVAVQLNHGGAKANKAGLRGMAPLGPSAFVFAEGNSMAREATQEEIHAVADAFAQAASKARKAGYDGILIHAAHSYLISEFLNPFYNKRTDEFGGSAENRFRLLGEIIEKSKAAAGEDFPIFVKFECNAAADDEAWFKDVIFFTNSCADLGVRLVEFSGCDYIPRGLKKERTYYIDRVAAIRKEVSVPVSVEGGVRTLAEMEKVLDAGIDMVGIGRPLVCEPDLITRLKNGQPEAKCISCSQCFMQFMKDGRYCIQHKKG
ncbi:MAG: NADH:flavin oxidoreductase [Lachnospiraceae bacterium]|nr:NADH:flavin oxidoreductase [Lachnospiraceae bacterium]